MNRKIIELKTLKNLFNSKFIRRTKNQIIFCLFSLGNKKMNTPPTTENPIWKDTFGFFRCLKCRFKSNSYRKVKIHYESKHRVF